MRSVLNKKTSADLLKLLVFVVVTSLATTVLVVTIGNIGFGSSRQYRAEFTDATGVNKGDDVRVAGVPVGTVSKVEIVDRTRALVTFDVDTETSVKDELEALVALRSVRGVRLRGDLDLTGLSQILKAFATIQGTDSAGQPDEGP